MPRRQLVSALVTGIGFAFVVVGSSLQWFRVDPRFDSFYPTSEYFPPLYESPLNPGLHGVDFLVLGVISTVLVGHVLVSESRWPAGITTVLGVGVVVYCLWGVFSSSVVGVDEAIYPVTGWYLSVVGGVLVIGGGLGSLRFDRRDHMVPEDSVST